MRPDGKRLKELDPFFQIVPFIMDKRYDAMNFIRQDLDQDPITEYIRDARKRGIKMSHLSVIIAAYLRTVSQFPQLNRFIMNKKIYARNHFCVCFVVLKNTDGGITDAEQTVLKSYFNLDDTILTVNEKINASIEANRRQETKNSMDKLLKKVMRFTGLVSFVVSVLKWADRHNLMPMSIIDASPFHTSLFITNMASLRTNYIYHHTYEFGTTGVFMALGQPVKTVELEKNVPCEHKYLPMGIVTDERICSGHYYAEAFKTFSKYLNNPILLETKPEKVNVE